MNETKIRLKDYSPPEVVNLIKDWQEPSYRAEQILDWMYRKKVVTADEMTNLPISLRNKLTEEAEIISLEIREKLVSSQDDTVKFLFRTIDGEFIESALMKQDYGNTICISSQIGCGLGCIFCASTRGGLVRNLTPAEMIDQVILAENSLEKEDRISNIVVMGMGEPLNNLINLIKFLYVANNSRGLGISFRNITVSTAGIAPQIINLAREKMPLTLAVSLHAPDNETRSRLMPVNKKYPLEEVLDSCRYYKETVGRRVSYEYILLKGINDSLLQARELARLLGNSLCHVNLIPANDIHEENIIKPKKKQIIGFYEVLKAAHIPVSIRREQGVDIDGACGQLRRRVEQL